MNDLHKYLIGTAAGILLCFLIWGGYSLLTGKEAQKNALIAGTERGGVSGAPASGRSSDILGNTDTPEREDYGADLTAEQQERLRAAQVANKSLAKKYRGEGDMLQTDSDLQDTFDRWTGEAEEPLTEDIRTENALALNRGNSVPERAPLQGTDNQRDETQRKQVRDFIVQGKSAAQKNQLSNALSAFENADEVMPNDKDFEATSYHEMADSLFLLSKTTSDQQAAQSARDEAELYIKKSLTARNNTDARALYSNIIEEQNKAADAKKQQALLAGRQAVERNQNDRRTEQQRRQVVELIGQGKNAVNKRQLGAAVSAFDKASSAMPDEKKFSSEAYTDMASEMLKLSQLLNESADTRTSLDKAENYVKQSLSLQESPDARSLYAKILDARKEQERAAQAKAEQQRKEQERAAQAKAGGAQKKLAQAVPSKNATQKTKTAEAEKERPKEYKQVENLLAQGAAAAQKKQLSNAVQSFDRAGRLMPKKDNDFASESYYKMADSMLGLSNNSPNQPTTQNALRKAEEYIKKSLAAKNTAEGQALAAKIAAARKAAQTNTPPAKQRKESQPNTPDARKTQQPNQRQPKDEKDKKDNKTAHTESAAALAAEKGKKAQAELQSRKREVDELVQQGKKTGARGNVSEAQDAFDKASALMPDGDKAFAASQYRDMADTMQELAKTKPAQKTQAVKSGTDYIKKSLAAKDDDGKAHFIYAQLAAEQNNTALAVQELEAARRLDPQNYLYNYELGRKYFEQKKYPQAKSCFEDAAKLNPQYEAAFFNLGITHKIMNASDAALTAFSKVAALKPEHVRAWVEMARVQDKKKNYAEAVKNYQKSLSLDPSNLSALKEMAQVYAKMKDMKQAERFFKEALSLGDTDSVTYYNLASVQLEAGSAADALQNAEKALSGNAKDARFLYTYALALEKNKREKEAEDYYVRAVAADEKYGKPRINLGRIHLETGKLESAEQHLQAAYNAEPSNFEVNMNLGKLYGLKTQYGKSIDYYTNAIKIMPQDITPRQNLAAVYLSAGLKENARDTYQAILKMNTQAWDSYYELGKLYITMDNKAEAKSVFEQLLKQKPNYAYAVEIKKLLMNL